MRAITELNEMKKIQMDIMAKVHLFCVKNDITYFLSHGSLIGAIRHKGFIPWDDDIDIFMPREEYEKFCILFPKKQSQYELELVNSFTKTYYGRPMSKVVDNRTLLYEPNYIGDDPIGVNVDIWPLDGAPKDSRIRKSHMKRLNSVQAMLHSRLIRFNNCKSFRQKMLHVLLRPFPSKVIVNQMIKLMTKYTYLESSYVACYVDPYKKVFKREWFADKVLVPFEDQQYYIPIGADEILTTLYGDYMKLPPEEKRQPHHVANAYWK